MDELLKKQQFLFETINELNRRMVDAQKRASEAKWWAEAYDAQRRRMNEEMHVLAKQIERATA